jgi:hypothetical protein
MKNIQLVRLTSGEEIIANVDLNGIDTDTIILKDAIVLIPAGEGKLGFMPFMPYTKAEDGFEIDLKFVMFMVEPVSDLIKQHESATSPIDLSASSGSGIIT